MIYYPVTIGGEAYNITCVSMGNPHCVVFCGAVNDVDLERVGPLFENASIFPERTNTEFVRVVNKTTLKMRTYERGNGETLACGTGACAAVVAAVENGYCQKDQDITVQVRGGELVVALYRTQVSPSPAAPGWSTPASWNIKKQPKRWKNRQTGRDGCSIPARFGIQTRLRRVRADVARKGAPPVAEEATAAAQQPLALAGPQRGREGLAATRTIGPYEGQWYEPPPRNYRASYERTAKATWTRDARNLRRK